MRKLQIVASNSRTVHAARQAFWLALVLVLPGGAQNLPGPRLPLPQPIGQRAGDSLDGPGGNPGEQMERLTALNRERQKSMVSDTNKLLKLASELDLEVKSGNSDALTPAQMRKLAAIEKLAHSVKDKMSYSMKGPGVFLPTPSFPVQ